MNAEDYSNKDILLAWIWIGIYNLASFVAASGWFSCFVLFTYKVVNKLKISTINGFCNVHPLIEHTVD